MCKPVTHSWSLAFAQCIAQNTAFYPKYWQQCARALGVACSSVLVLFAHVTEAGHSIALATNKRGAKLASRKADDDLLELRLYVLKWATLA